MNSNPTATMTQTPNSKPRKSVDAETLLASLAPMVAKPDTPKADAPPRTLGDTSDKSSSERADPAKPVTRSRRTSKAQPKTSNPTMRTTEDNKRAKLDVEINPGEGSTAIYVRVPRTTHMALKLLALQNQALMEGPTELASVVRAAIDEYLGKAENQLRRAG